VRRRILVTALVVVSLALLSVYFRESNGGPLHGVQSAGSTVLRPFEVGAEHVARPFRDAASWFSGLVDAKSENAKLRRENDRLRQQVVQDVTAAQENAQFRRLLALRGSARFPSDFRALAATVISRPSGQFVQQVTVGVGSSSGVRLHSPVVTADGLVGQVTKVARRVSLVALLTDETSAASGVDLRTGASGIVRHGQSTGSTLILDRVAKDQIVHQNDIVITAGWCSGRLSDIYPKGLPIGVVTSVGQVDTDLYKNIQIQPFADFSSLEFVLVLVPTQPQLC
jgi:rod shape-determining protein MreC